MSDQTVDYNIRAVELGDVLPKDAGSSSTAYYVIIALLGLTAIGMAVLLEGSNRILAVVPAIAGCAIGVYNYRQREAPHLPQVSGIDLVSVSDFDVDEIANHLVGKYSGEVRGLPNSEIVIARVDSHNAKSISQIPKACGQRWDRNKLHTVLIAVPRAPPKELEKVSDEYDAVILVDDINDISSLLEHIQEVLCQPEAKDIKGIGSATIRKINTNDRAPGDPGLREELNAGRGKPFDPLAASLRENKDHQPSVTAISGPSEFIEAALVSIKDDHKNIISIYDSTETISITRIYMTSPRPIGNGNNDWPRNSVRGGG